MTQMEERLTKKDKELKDKEDAHTQLMADLEASNLKWKQVVDKKMLNEEELRLGALSTMRCSTMR